MRSLPCALFAVGTLLASARAEDAAAKITRVTVYADRAEVVRHLETKLAPGEHTLVFDDLPGGTDLSSVRVDGRGAFTLIDIRAESVQTAEVENSAVRALAGQIRAEKAKLQQIAHADTRATQRRAALDKVLSRLTSVGKESANPDMDPSKWAAYLQYHVDSLAKLDREALENKVSTEAIRKEADRLGRELGLLSHQRNRFRNVARVKVDLRQADDIAIDLSYVVAGPSWRPLYDLRADTQAGKLSVAYNAEVRQATGEDWKSVNLRLSTAQPGIGGREPQLAAWFVRRHEPMPASTSGGFAFGGGVAAGGGGDGRQAGHKNQLGKELALYNDLNAPAADPQRQVEFLRAAVFSGGTSATFTIARTYDVPSDNKPVKVGIALETFDAKFHHTCVPKLSPHVYLKATAVNKSDYPFLAGPTAVFLDGAFVANASLDLVPAGQDFATHLGIDQSVSAERKELAKREEVSGLFGKKTHRTAYDYVFKLRNSKPAPVELTVLDQLPVSTHEEIRVVVQEPRYEKDTEEFKLSDQKTAEWKLRLAPGEKKDLPFRFAVERPEDFQLSGQ